MTDFLVSMGAARTSDDLVAAMRAPYVSRVPRARGFTLPWGCLAVMEESRVGGGNILFREGVLLAWVGDLIAPDPGVLMDAFVDCIAKTRVSMEDVESMVRSHRLFQELNGAFAILFAHQQGVAIVTDLRNFVPAYGLRRADQTFCGFGTHADSVASLTQGQSRIDPVSVGEFLVSGSISFPYSAYENVIRLNSASMYDVRPDARRQVETRVTCYWQPPKELVAYDERDLADQLRSALTESVRDRSRHPRIAVQLSGGLDSRVIMALVPSENECLGLTFCDRLNRETRMAQKVARCYARPWYPMFRSPEYLGGMIEAAVRFVGCEGEFMHAHAFGLLDEIEQIGAHCVLDGVKLDTYLKGYFAEDMIRVARMGGLLPPEYVKRHYSHSEVVDAFSGGGLAVDMVEKIRKRRSDFCAAYSDSRRSSTAEWLRIHPQDSRMAGWSIERRMLPKSLVAVDRRIVEFGFRCPMALKLGDTVFRAAVRDLYGPGSNIPSANDGVRPCSGHLWRLVQRAIRKSQDRFTGIAERFGRKVSIQHSWHDYPTYWRESEKLAMLRRQYGPNLSCLDGVLFEGNGHALLEDRNLSWEHGFRLLQLAVWLGLRKEYASAACDASISYSCPSLDSTRGTNTAP